MVLTKFKKKKIDFITRLLVARPAMFSGIVKLYICHVQVMTELGGGKLV